MSTDDADAARSLAGLPSAARDDDEDAKRFDLVMLRHQLAVLEGDTGTADQLRGVVQSIASALLTKTTIPAVAAQATLLESLAGDPWWVDVTLPMLETARRRVRGLVRFIERTFRNPVYTDFVDELGEATTVDLPETTPGTDTERFLAKATAYLRRHRDHVTLQRLRRNRQLTQEDLAALEKMLANLGGTSVDIAHLAEERGGLGLFVRSVVGLERSAAVEAFSAYLDDGRFTADQIRFVTLIIDELSTNGVVEPDRLYESPFTDYAPTGPDLVFPNPQVDRIVEILDTIKHRAVPLDVA